jgi:hypothetical protein
MRIKTKAFPIYAFAALLAAVPGVAGGAASAAPKPISWDPAPYAQYKARDYEEISIGDFKILNAPWGKGSITAYRQCVFKASYQDDVPFGWKWDWPKTRTDDVKASQSLSYGWNPWMKDRTNAILSARVGSVTSLRVDYAAEVNASGKSKDYSFYRIPDLNLHQGQADARREPRPG